MAPDATNQPPTARVPRIPAIVAATTVAIAMTPDSPGAPPPQSRAHSQAPTAPMDRIRMSLYGEPK